MSNRMTSQAVNPIPPRIMFLLRDITLSCGVVMLWLERAQPSYQNGSLCKWCHDEKNYFWVSQYKFSHSAFRPVFDLTDSEVPLAEWRRNCSIIFKDPY